MEYLTTHDLVWINNSVTGKVHDYDYFKLEAVMASQYQYGQSKDVPKQAAQMLDRMLMHPPFFAGNLRTAFIAVLTFLNANGYATTLKDEEAARLLIAVTTRDTTADQAVLKMAAPAKTSLPAGIPLRQLITHECNLHVEGLQLLAEGD